MTAPALPLAGWDNFYVIIGSSAAALTGLMFVVIALTAEVKSAGEDAVRAFGTPNIVHFCAVLLIAAILTTPRHTVASLRACFLACAIGGLSYGVAVILHARRQKSYAPVLSDWIWHTALPFLAYAAFLVAGVLLRSAADAALYVVAAAALLLLYIGIHNAWDSAVWMTTNRQRSEK